MGQGSALAEKTCPQIILELLVALRQDGAGRRWERSLAGQLARFGKRFDGPLSAVTAGEVNDWLRSLAVGVRCRNNYRAAVIRLVNFAKGRGYLREAWNELGRVEHPKARRREIRVLTPEELQKLLAGTKPNMLAFTVLQAFAGLRHEEVRRLNWSDIDLVKREIYVPLAVGKTGDRIVPLADNLVKWLRPLARKRGPVARLKKTSAALGRAKGRASILAGKNETRNALRKSWISYRLAMTRNITQTAEEAGNSPGVIKTNYRRPVLAETAREWFALVPGDEKTPQMDFDFAPATTILFKVKVAQDSNLRPRQKPPQPPQTNGVERNGVHREQTNDFLTADGRGQ